MPSLPAQMTHDARVTLDFARREAAQRHSPYIDVEHLLLGLLRHETGPAARLLEQHGGDVHTLYEQVAGAVGMERPDPIDVRDYSRAAKTALTRAAQGAEALQQATLGSRHMLLALMGEPDGAVHDTLSGIALTAEDVRAHLQAHIPPPSAGGVFSQPGQASQSDQDGEIVLVPVRASRSRPRSPSGPRPGQKPGKSSTRQQNIPWLVIGLVGIVMYMVFALPGNAVFTFLFVLVGWIFSVTLHEFAHALVAYLGGDWTVRDKGYLSFNPLKYTHPMTSIILPLLFLAMGGIGLPGGAVYIERHRLRNKWWGAAVSAAGPAANLLLAVLLSAPFFLGLVDTRVIQFKIWDIYPDQGGTIWQDSALWSAVALLAMLQVTGVIFNLLPFPPLDGFGIIEPFLDPRMAAQLRQFGMYGLLLIFLILWSPLGREFWDFVFEVVNFLQIPNELLSEGFRDFMFWKPPPN
ncbi:MAG: hypothetical protein JXQ72_09355 [Anaerolineae bacterium]|nr:hypothetical protein [Anaerolineae bacterium]